MDFRREIAQRIESLAPDQQAQVLQFVTSLSASALKGERGGDLRAFAHSLDSESAQQMIQAIDDGCEHVEAGEW